MGSGWVTALLLIGVGVVVGILIADNTKGFAFEVKPDNTFRVAIAFNDKLALPR